MASITTSDTCSATRCSRNAKIWFVVAAQVRTVSTVFRRPEPVIRMQTFASRFDTSIPAQRL